MNEISFIRVLSTATTPVEHEWSRDILDQQNEHALRQPRNSLSHKSDIYDTWNHNVPDRQPLNLCGKVFLVPLWIPHGE